MAKKKKKDALNYQRTEFYDIRPVPNLKTANFGGKTYRVLYGRSDQALGGTEWIWRNVGRGDVAAADAV